MKEKLKIPLENKEKRDESELIELEAGDLEIISVLREDGFRDKDVGDIDIEDELKDFYYITDTSERTVREDERHRRFYEDPSESGISIKAPTSLPWPVVGSIAVAIVSVIFNITSVYMRQGSVNEELLRRAQESSEDIRDIREKTYTKKEIDLQLETHRAELRRLDEKTRELRGDLEHLERKGGH